MGYQEGAARQPYKPGSVIAKVVDEVVDHLKDWTHPEPTPPAQAADSVLEDTARLDFILSAVRRDNMEMLMSALHDDDGFPLERDKAIAAIDAARKQGANHGNN